MSNRLFNKQELINLRMNKYVKNVTSKSITYTTDFKIFFIEEFLGGKSTIQIFEEAGFDTEVLGTHRIYSSQKRWLSSYKKDGIVSLEDTRSQNSGRPRDKELTQEDRIAKLEAKVKLQEKQIEMLNTNVQINIPNLLRLKGYTFNRLFYSFLICL